MAKKQSGIYLIALSAMLMVGFGLLELGARNVSQFGGPNNKFIHKLYNEKRTNAVFGDSHVGNTDWLGEDFAFIGNGGMSFFEQLRTAKFYFRNKKPGKIIIETGPQLFSRTHDKSWRTLPVGSLSDGPFAGRLYALEPLFIQEILNYFTNGTKSLFQISKAKAQTKSRDSTKHTDREASKTSRKLQDAGGSNFDFEKVPKWARDRIIQNLAKSFRPVRNFQQRIAWQSFAELVGFLKDNGAEICLVRVAVSPELEAVMLSGKNRTKNKEARRAVAALAKNSNITYIDSRDLKKQFNISNFRNQDHLNANGARLYWETANEACFNDNKRSKFTYENAMLRDTVMANGSAKDKFAWWDLKLSKGVTLEKTKHYYPLTVVKDRRAWQLKASNNNSEFSFSKYLGVRQGGRLVASINAKAISALGNDGNIQMRIAYENKSGKLLHKDVIEYSLDDLNSHTTYKGNAKQSWAGIVLRSKIPARAHAARLEIHGSLNQGENIILDNFYLMATTKIVDKTKLKRRNN